MAFPRRDERPRRRGRRSGPGSDPDPGPVEVSVALERLRAQLGLPDPAVIEVMSSRWGEIVGAGIAAHARPRGLRDGLLTIAVDAGSWATELRYLETQICARALEVTGVPVVTSVRVVVEPPPGPAP